MPLPQIKNRKSSYRENPPYSESVFSQLQETRTEFRDTRKEINQRMDRIERRMDNLEEKLDSTRRELNANINEDDKIDRLADKIDELHKEIKSSTNHGQIAAISTVGVGVSAVSITLGVLYTLLFK